MSKSPLLSVECVALGLKGADLQVLLIPSESSPGHWVLPHQVVRKDESLEAAARRALADFHFSHLYLEQLYSFSDPKRNPGQRVVSVAYFALIRRCTELNSGQWHPLAKLPRLAFDHREIVERALERVRGKIRYAPIGFELLDRKFTLSQVQQVFETILDRSVDKRNFRKKILSLPFVSAHEEFETGVSHRAARLYSFDHTRFGEMKKRGFDFEL